jgi:methylamine dehydrogenase accessory protein MauD
VEQALPFIVVLQMIVTLVLAVLVFGLARQVGILHERVAPMGAMTSDHGPAAGAMAPTLSVTTLSGDPLVIGGMSAKGRSRLLLFVSPACPVCKKLLPIARSFSNAERLEIILIGDGELAEQLDMVKQFDLESIAYVNSPQVGMAFQVGKLPYAILIDAEGVIRAKGLVNNREHLESLLVAEETGFGTIQSYLAAKARNATENAPPTGFSTRELASTSQEHNEHEITSL